MTKTDEKERFRAELEEIAGRSIYAIGVSAEMIRYTRKILARWLVPGARTLELGPAEGLLTDAIAEIAGSLTLVDGAQEFCDQLQGRFPSAEIVCTLFEDYRPEELFHQVVLGHVMEHVEYPVSILERVLLWTEPGGTVFAAVPNAHSIHRQAAVIMGLLENETSMSDKDRLHGHRRIYDRFAFANDFRMAGFEIEHVGGYWLKPISDQQIEQDWTPEMLQAFFQLGEAYPDSAAEIYVVARRPTA